MGIMEIERINIPLFTHSLSESEMDALPLERRSLAKDWSITNKKLDWLINEHVFLHNVIVDHDKKFTDYDKKLAISRMFTRLITYIVSSAGGILIVWKFLKGAGVI